MSENAGQSLTETPVSDSLPDPSALVDRLTATQIAEAVASYEGGASSRTIAEPLGISKSALLALLRERGVEIRKLSGLSDADVDKAAILYESGRLLREIAEQFGVSRDCVRLALKKRGVQLRLGLGARRA